MKSLLISEIPYQHTKAEIEKVKNRGRHDTHVPISMLNIYPGARLAYFADPTLVCVVLSDRKVFWKGKEYSQTALQKVWGKMRGIGYRSPKTAFMFNGELLCEIEERLGFKWKGGKNK